jgi:glutamate dehydrogenase (NAD(P)+)
MSALGEFAVEVDELGPARVTLVSNSSMGLRAALVVDNVACGPAIGGLRMAPDVSVEECARLARAMTLKNAAAGLPHGGGKSVLWGDPRMPRAAKESLIRAFAHALRGEQDYIFGPDMGTDESCMAWVKDEIGRAVGLPEALGGIPLDEIGATGWGIRHAAEVAARATGFALKGARVAVQGFGAVGRHAARFLAAEGAVLVAAADSTATVADAEGLDLESLIAAKRAGKPFSALKRAKVSAANAVIGVECEIWIPAARPDVIREDNADRLRARVVVEGANIPTTLAAERSLHARGVMVVPDFIANAGGVICAAIEFHDGTRSQAMAAIEERIVENTETMLRMARERAVTPREAATELALSRVQSAMSLRRFQNM